MTWIKTVPFADTDDALRRAYEMQRAMYPAEYDTPVHPVEGGQTSQIVASHSLIPVALYHAFATFGALLSPDMTRFSSIVAAHRLTSKWTAFKTAFEL